MSDDVRLYLGDCLDILRTMPDASVDAVVMDPPYGVEMNYASYRDDEASTRTLILSAITECRRVSKITLTTVGKFSIETWLYQVAPPRWRICWRKGITSRPSPIGFTDWEPIFVYGERVHRNTHDLFTAQSELMGNHGHPCPKSLDWARWLVSHFCDEGGIVLDPFMGSGTTGVACVRTGRRFIGIEIDPTYYAIAQRRIADAQLQPSLFPSSNHGFHLTAAPVGLWDADNESGAAAN